MKLLKIEDCESCPFFKARYGHDKLEIRARCDRKNKKPILFLDTLPPKWCPLEDAAEQSVEDAYDTPLDDGPGDWDYNY